MTRLDLVTGVLVICAVWGLLSLPQTVLDGRAQAVPAAPARAGPPDTASVALDPTAIARAVAAAPFRRTRTRAAALAAPGSGAGAVAEARVALPHLSLAGIVFDASPLAIVEGVPGSPGYSVLAAEDTAGGLRVVAIARDTVTLAGFDTTWVLTVKEIWR